MCRSDSSGCLTQPPLPGISGSPGADRAPGRAEVLGAGEARAPPGRQLSGATTLTPSPGGPCSAPRAPRLHQHLGGRRLLLRAWAGGGPPPTLPGPARGVWTGPAPGGPLAGRPEPPGPGSVLSRPAAASSPLPGSSGAAPPPPALRLRPARKEAPSPRDSPPASRLQLVPSSVREASCLTTQV